MFLQLILIFLTGIASSFINIMAGGGSILNLGAMVLLGVEPAVANGTNRVGLLVQNISGIRSYLKNGKNHIKKGIKISMIVLPGALIGAYIAINISGEIFKKMMSIAILIVVLSLFLPKKARIKKLKNDFIFYILMFLIGIYGGFIQAGVGFLIMATFKHLKDMSLVEINFYKIMIILVYNIPIILMFGVTNNINLIYALALSLGNFIGANLSVKFSLAKGEKGVKIAVGVAVLLMGIKLFYD